MRLVKKGDRGPAVEDIQRRLLALGRDLGPTGIDGIFLQSTAEAIRQFQEESGLYADGVVGPRTWSALVDSTFAFGDRMLYLRTPYFHGNDVRTLQGALNSLGFACGEEDAIFGTFTERAVVEFQQNAGLDSDGIVGQGTIAALSALRHIWGPRSSGAHSQAHGSPVDRTYSLSALDVTVVAGPGVASEIARRMVNVAEASTPDARFRAVGSLDNVAVPDASEGAGETTGSPRRHIVISLFVPTATPSEPEPAPLDLDGAVEGPIPYLPEKAAFAQTLRTALAADENRLPTLGIAIGNESFSRGSKQGVQRVATTLLDALCLAVR